MQNVHVLINPDAGRGTGSTRADAAITALRARGLDPVIHSGASPEESCRLAADAVAAKPDALVIVGGDGTLSTVVDVLAGSGVPLVLVPAGTGNDLARSLGIPFGSDEAAADAAAAAVDGVVRSLDIGQATCADGMTHFLTVAAIGFDAKVSERTNRLRWPRGRARYYLALVIELLRLAPMRFSLRVDGVDSPVSDGTLVAVGNTRSYGGGMPVCPEADPHDGLLDVVHVAAIGRFELIRFFPHLLRGTHVQLPQVTTMRGSEVEVSAPGLVVYADGERVGTESVRIRVVAGALSILLPE
ncbi:MAG: diacylglycerol kinase [Microbacterium sp.]